jgi:hypothetical protein
MKCAHLCSSLCLDGQRRDPLVFKAEDCLVAVCETYLERACRPLGVLGSVLKIRPNVDDIHNLRSIIASHQRTSTNSTSHHSSALHLQQARALQHRPVHGLNIRG